MREETERVLVGVALQTNMSGHPIIDAGVRTRVAAIRCSTVQLLYCHRLAECGDRRRMKRTRNGSCDHVAALSLSTQVLFIGELHISRIIALPPNHPWHASCLQASILQLFRTQTDYWAPREKHTIRRWAKPELPFESASMVKCSAPPRSTSHHPYPCAPDPRLFF